jgi:imidazolonepropionase-like amidohydrolase
MTLVVRAAKLLTGRDEPAVARPEIVVDGERITAVRTRGTVPTPPDATVVDLGGRTLLPGLIDAHVHLMGVDPRFGPDPFGRSLVLRALRAATDARTVLEAGFTSARCLGSPVSIDLGRAIDLGLVPGPRIVSSGEFICGDGGPWDRTDLPRAWSEAAGILANGVDACREAARQRLRAGAGVVKAGASAGGPHDAIHAWGDDPHRVRTTYTAAELRALADEAHHAGLKLAVHAIGSEAVAMAVEAGADTIEHGHAIDAETRAILAGSGVILVTTLAVMHQRLMLGPALGMPEAQRRAAAAHVESQRESLAAAIDAGVRIALGTDLWGPPYAELGPNGIEFELYTACGASPHQAVVAGTATAAAALGREGDIGVVAEGWYADLVAADDDPLDDVTALQRVSFVMKGGAIVKAPPSPEGSAGGSNPEAGR